VQVSNANNPEGVGELGDGASVVYAPNQRCQGNTGYNNFYGKGMVDAFKAVTE